MLLAMELSIVAFARSKRAARACSSTGTLEKGAYISGEDVSEGQPKFPWMGLQKKGCV